MKIGHNPDKAAALPAATSPAPVNDATKAQATTAIPSTADASAKIALSNEATSLISGGSTTDVDAEKVARIAKAIDDGSYKIDPQVIADKLISNAQELLSKK
jgi:negative regulator of flagellin synthesis FlgM